MSALPAPLRPWAAELGALAPELAVGLVPMLRGLDALLGAVGSPRDLRTGDPEGFDGLDRRGPYERLMISEWLLADEAPLEFLRRATQGEHSFLHLARRRARQTERRLLLVDTGPDVLGAPRLAQLVALVVLARRARQHGVALRVGPLHDPNGACDVVDDRTVRALLDARTDTPPTPEHVHAWLAAHLGAGPAELVLIGGPGLPELGATRLIVVDPCESGPPTLDVHLHHRAQHRTLRLPTPAEPTPTQLIRSWGRSPAVGLPVHGALSTALFRFSEDGRRLLARREDGDVIAWHVPDRPGLEAGRPAFTRPPKGHRLVAVGYQGRGFNVVSCATDAPERLHLQLGGLRREVERTRPHREDVIGTIVLAHQTYYLHDEDGHAYIIDDASLRPLHPDPVPFTAAHGWTNPLWLRSTADGLEPAHEEAVHFHAVPTPKDVRKVHFGWTPQALCIGLERPGEVVVHVWQHGTRQADRRRAESFRPLPIPDACLVMGVTCLRRPPHTDADPVLVLCRGERELLLFGDHAVPYLGPAEDPIVRVAVSTHAPKIAWLERSGRVVVQRLGDQAPLLIVPPSGLTP